VTDGGTNTATLLFLQVWHEVTDEKSGAWLPQLRRSSVESDRTTMLLKMVNNSGLETHGERTSLALSKLRKMFSRARATRERSRESGYSPTRVGVEHWSAVTMRSKRAGVGPESSSETVARVDGWSEHADEAVDKGQRERIVSGPE
jgi:hypothetical protein